MITQNIHVRMDAYGIPPVIHAVEGDTWRYLDIYTDDAAINTSNTAVVAIHRPDDSYYTIEAMPEPLFYHLEMDQALTRPGKVECQLKVSSGDLVISTYTFYIVVEPSTTGLPTEQLGYDIYDLIDAAQQIQNVGLTEEIKQALLDCFEHVAWTDEHGQDYVDALEAALYPPAELASISAVYTQSGTVYTTDTLDSLKTNLVVTAHYSDSTTETVTTYTLSGTLTEGTSVITVTYEGKTTTFNVTVTAPATLSSITAVYTQSGTVYDTDSLDSLKSDLVVTAVYSDSTTQTVASTDYTLSGTLTKGTSTITVSYGGKTTTFTVVVSQELYVTDGLIHWWDAIDNTSNGHDSSATTWKDLVGDMDLSKLSGSTSSWESDALVFTGDSNSEWTADSSETIYNKTVEVAITVTQSSSRLVLFAFSSNLIGKFAVFQDNSFNVTGISGRSYDTGENSILDLHHIAGVYGATGNIAGVYGNGTPKTQGNATHSFSGTEPHMVVGGTVHYSFIGKIHSIRMYNRQLTADEIAKNYASDVARFGLE